MRFFRLLAGLALAEALLFAQSSTDGITPKAIEPGTPDGSYILGAFDTVNYGNMNPNFRFPLLKVGGRGAVSAILMPDFTNMWDVQVVPNLSCGQSGCTVLNYNYFPHASGWEAVPPLYGAGRLLMRSGVGGCSSLGYGEYAWNSATTRFTFVSPDGTETEFVDQKTGGEPEAGETISAFDRGTAFISRDGTSARFVSSTDVNDSTLTCHGGSSGASGVVTFRDGTQYTVSNGYVTQIQDANGNLLTFPNIETGNDNYTIVSPSGGTIQVQLQLLDQPTGRLYDEITYPGYLGVNRTINVFRDSLQNVLRSDQSLQTMGVLWPNVVLLPNQPAEYNTTFDPSDRISEIDLPDGSSYTFRYNSYGDVARIVLPTGGALEYDYYHNTLAGGGGVSQAYVYTLTRQLSARREYLHASDNTPSRVTTYSQATVGSNTVATVKDYDGAGNLLSEQTHTDVPVPVVPPADPQLETSWMSGRELQAQYFGANGSPLLRTVATAYTQQACTTQPICSWYQSQYSVNSIQDPNAPPNDPQTTSETTTEGSKVRSETYGYDTNNNRTDDYLYDWGNGASGPLLRHTQTTFDTNPTYVNPNINILGLPLETKVFSGSGAQVSDTTYGYDETAPVDAPSIISHSAAFGPGYTTRGNRTSTNVWLNTTNGYLSTKFQRNIAGNITSVTDPKNAVTAVSWSDSSYTYANVTSMTNPLSQTQSWSYDYPSGKLVSATDPNGITTTYSYQDPLDRVTLIEPGSNSSIPAETNVVYTSPTDVQIYKDQNSLGDSALHSEILYDGLGRVGEKRNYESGSGYINTVSAYDALGRLASSTNPSRPGDGLNYSTTYTWDGLGRKTRTAFPDGSAAIVSYSANTTTATDEAGHASTTISDGAGRLTQVTDGLGYIATYSYDALDDLTGVAQGAQARSFSYDSLKRLTQALNPESGTVSYTYDNNGNVLTKTDARGVLATSAYDALNRLTSQIYSDGTPSVTYTYDAAGVTNSRGRLTQIYSLPSTTNYTAYDALGHITGSNQVTDGQTYTFGYTYNRAGALLAETYPSGRVVTDAYDGAGRLASVAGSYGGNGTNYATAIGYAPAGALSSLTLANSLVGSVAYNSRLQPISMTDVVNGTTQLGLTLGWGSTNNNGNLLSETINGGGQTFTQTFGYDADNRLTSGSDTGGWSRNFSYDQYGNMWVSGSSGIALSALTPSAQSWYIASSNRIQGDNYDLAGNQLNFGSAGTVTLAYDAASRVKSAVITGTGTATYQYDGSGRRVLRVTPDGVTSVYVYDAAGELAAKYSSGGTPTAPCNTCYIGWDHLGTSRLMTDASGAVISRHDFLPFGEEILSNQAGRTSAWDTSDNLNQKFTGKLRDAETGLDYFGARYYGAIQGRFTSADEPFADQRAADPQSWNSFIYVRNNPLAATDADGHGACEAAAGANTNDWLRCKGVSSTITSSDSGPTISGLPKTLGTHPGERLVGAAKAILAGALDFGDWAVGGNGNTEAANLASKLAPRTQDEEFGGEVVGIAGFLTSAGDISKMISSGHALAKHISEFADLGISSQEELEMLVREIVTPGSEGIESKPLTAGRTAYYDEKRNIVVIHDPSSPDKGTVFRPAAGRVYFHEKLK